jgi:hypothetical protein
MDTLAEQRVARPQSAGDSPMKNFILRFLNGAIGATAIEFGLIAAGIAIAVIVVLIRR